MNALHVTPEVLEDASESAVLLGDLDLLMISVCYGYLPWRSSDYRESLCRILVDYAIVNSIVPSGP